MKRLQSSIVSSYIFPFTWIPSLYLAEGIPNVIITMVALVMLKRLGMDNAETTFLISWLYLPWVIKPFWSPIVDMFGTKRMWIWAMQVLIGSALAGVAFLLPIGDTLSWILALLWLVAFCSATHDIAADGFYMLELDNQKQALYIGLRSFFYRCATIVCSGPLIMLAGALEVYYGVAARAWGVVFGISALVFLCFAAYHFFVLPRPLSDTPKPKSISVERTVLTMLRTFVTFFQKPDIPAALAGLVFMLLYRFPEALLTPICKCFLIDPIEKGGLGLTTSEVGFVQGTVGVIGLLLGGILGGIAIARDGFGRWKWPMVFAISVPNLVYVYLAYFQPQDLWSVSTCIFLEQFGYGFGFTAYMMFLLYFAKGASETSHYAFCTGFMALSMMIPGFYAGSMQVGIGYLNFFILVIICTPITFLVTSLIKVNPLFGRKETMVAQEN